MIAQLDRTNCIGCGLCAETCPEVFRLAEDGFARVIRERVPREAERSAVSARDGCPVAVISILKQKNP